MKTRLKKFICTLLLINIWSCAYKSIVPIDSPSQSNIDELLKGDWVGLEGDSTVLYSTFEVNLQGFNDKEYAAILKFYDRKGQRLRDVEIYKVFNSKVEEYTYLNVKDLDPLNKKYIFFRIENINADSIQLRCLTDSLNQVFSTSNEFKTYLKQQERYIEEHALSPIQTLYRWSSINWDDVNLKEETKDFKEFYLLGKIDEESFLKMEGQALWNLIKGKKGIPIEKVKTHFSKITLIRNGLTFWKAPNYALLKLKNEEIIKFKIDMLSGIVEDLTNNRKYRNMNDEKWKF